MVETSHLGFFFLLFLGTLRSFYLFLSLFERSQKLGKERRAPWSVFLLSIRSVSLTFECDDKISSKDDKHLQVWHPQRQVLRLQRVQRFPVREEIAHLRKEKKQGREKNLQWPLPSLPPYGEKKKGRYVRKK